jgi:hypothetical protein
MLIWYGAGLVTAVLIAWLAATVYAWIPVPVGLVSLVVGIALGATISGIAATHRLVWGWRLILGSVVLSIVTILAEHAWLYLEFRQQWHTERTRSAAVAMFRPEAPLSPAEYFAREATPPQLALWCVDAAIITACTLGTVFLMRRKQR